MTRLTRPRELFRSRFDDCFDGCFAFVFDGLAQLGQNGLIKTVDQNGHSLFIASSFPRTLQAVGVSRVRVSVSV